MYLRGKWSDLRLSADAPSTRSYSRFDILSLAKGKVAGQIDARQTFPRVYQIGIALEDWALASGLGLDAAIALGAWLFDFRDAHAIVVVTSVDNQPLDGLFRLGIADQSALSPGYLREGEMPVTARWGVVTRDLFEYENRLLREIRSRYPTFHDHGAAQESE